MIYLSHPKHTYVGESYDDTENDDDDDRGDESRKENDE